MKTRRSWIHRFILVGFGLLVLLGMYLLGAPGPESTIPGSVVTPGAHGHQIAFRLLRGTGFEPEAWRQAPLALPEGEHLLWISSAPSGVSGVDSDILEIEYDQDGEIDPASADPRHPWNYKNFVEGGGTLVLTDREVEVEWLTEGLRIELPPWNGIRAGTSPLVLELESGERLVVSAELEGGATLRGYDDSWHDLAVDLNGDPFASWTPVALGRVVLLADDAFLRNDTIGESDDGLLLVRLVEALDRGGRLLFDEYALGRWDPPTSTSLLTDPGLLEVSLHVILLALLVVLAAAWAREFPRDPDALPASPRVRATAQGRFLERARRFDLSAEQLRLGVLRRLARHFKLTRAAAAMREDGDSEAVVALTREVARLAGASADEWVQLFAEGRVRSREDLAALAESLESIEREVQVHGRANARGENTHR